MMPIGEALGLGAAAAIAGAINAVAGGGTLLTFPVLTFFGTPKIIANATSTLALVIGTGGASSACAARSARCARGSCALCP